MECVIVHCSQEFTPGQTYVALSRVREEKALQVIGFQCRFLLPSPAELTTLIKNKSESSDPTFDCCKNMQLDEGLFQCIELECDNDLEEESDELVSDVDDANVETNAKQFFEFSAGVPVNLEDVLLCMCNYPHLHDSSL